MFIGQEWKKMEPHLAGSGEETLFGLTAPFWLRSTHGESVSVPFTGVKWNRYHRHENALMIS